MTGAFAISYDNATGELTLTLGEDVDGADLVGGTPSTTTTGAPVVLHLESRPPSTAPTTPSR